MKTAVRVADSAVSEIPFQQASLDIWDKKYRLVAKDGALLDKTLDDTYKRVARAVADVEPEERRGYWYERFLWALRRGAIPAGRIMSNAGALQHKPATSTINCTVSGTIHDSMDDILQKVHEAGLTLKAGCVAPGTLVYTDRGLVPVELAVRERHADILAFDRETRRFELRPILEHMTTHVPRDDNIEIVSNRATLRTSARHPVLVYRGGRLRYVRADEVSEDDALVHHRFEWAAAAERCSDAWHAGAELGSANVFPQLRIYAPATTTGIGQLRARASQLLQRVRGAEHELVERGLAFLRGMWGAAPEVASVTAGLRDFELGGQGFEAHAAARRLDGPGGDRVPASRIPVWITRHPERHFLPFFAGLVDTAGTVGDETGGVSIAVAGIHVAEELSELLALFGVHAGLTARKAFKRELAGRMVEARGGVAIRISDEAFLREVTRYMADAHKREQILALEGANGEHDFHAMPQELREALERERGGLVPRERRELGLDAGAHRGARVSRARLDRWSLRFPELAGPIGLARCLRPVESIRRGLDLPETFYDFTVEKHNNYLAGNGGLAVIHNCGIGYEFSTLRPRGAYVSGAGAYTSGPLSFMDIYDKMCFTVSSAGGRRGAQMGTFDIGHPDVMEFIRAKRENGRLRQFNLSLLIRDEFMQAVREDREWKLAFPLLDNQAELEGIDIDDPAQVVWRDWPVKEGYVTNGDGLVACKVYKTLPARRVWDVIMSSTYDFAEPGFVLIDRINEMNNNWWEEHIRATNPCGEQPLPPFGSCLLGSVNLTRFVHNAFTTDARFDWEEFHKVVKVFTRMLDDVVEIHGLPLEQQRKEIERKRRHGMGFLGLGSTLTMLRMKYGSPESVEFTEKVARELALAGWETALELAREKGPAPIMEEEFTVTREMLRERPEMVADGWRRGTKIPGRVLHARYSRYMQRVAEVAPDLVDELAEVGARFTHHSSIAPTGTISLSLANNASNGIEPSFAHHYFRNVIREGKKSKEKIDVFSYELLALRTLVNAKAMPGSDRAEEALPDYFVTAEDIGPRQHVDIQAAAQRWVDSSISKTANVPTDYPYEDFKDIYMYAYEKGLKGCTTFRYNPEAFQGVLVKERDLKNTIYRFTLADGTVVEARGDEEIEYDGELHTAANLYDALKEGYYGKF